MESMLMAIRQSATASQPTHPASDSEVMETRDLRTRDDTILGVIGEMTGGQRGAAGAVAEERVTTLVAVALAPSEETSR